MTFDPGLAAASTKQARSAESDHHAVLVEQLETAQHLFDGNFDGEQTVDVAFRDAWIGLGISEALDGEIAVVDGVVWRIPDTGIPEVADPKLLVPFAVSEARAEPSEITTVEVPTGTTFEQLAQLVDAQTHEYITVRVDGTFRDVVLRSEHKQSPPYQQLADVLSVDSDQEVRFNFDSWSGVMVGYRFPDPRDGALLPGLHLHAISHDQLSGGHCRTMVVDRATLTWAKADVEVTLPAERMQELLDADLEHHDEIRAGLARKEDPRDIAHRLGLA